MHVRAQAWSLLVVRLRVGPARRRSIMHSMGVAQCTRPDPTWQRPATFLRGHVCARVPRVCWNAVLNDFLHADLAYAFPDLVANFAKVTSVQSADHILNTYAACISKFAEKRCVPVRFARPASARTLDRRHASRAAGHGCMIALRVIVECWAARSIALALDETQISGRQDQAVGERTR